MRLFSVHPARLAITINRCLIHPTIAPGCSVTRASYPHGRVSPNTCFLKRLCELTSNLYRLKTFLTLSQLLGNSKNRLWQPNCAASSPLT
ncbi:Hypp5826 [Branchiostoma lanceolatum]|uniref:Hypp5826 protein n=1 Tax=Branchiostoma lanceolatum TaxID=7740 RepID=A0A8J9VGF8_BRALA|nr:Hypp5826 [Branchiostoma lanceolatum]